MPWVWLLVALYDAWNPMKIITYTSGLTPLSTQDRLRQSLASMHGLQDARQDMFRLQ
jgi:hypothetical protein